MRFSVVLRQTLAAAGLCAVALPALAQVVIQDPPPEHHFGKIPLGADYAAQYFSVFNQGSSPVTLGQARIDGDMAVCMALGCPTIAPTDFRLETADGCSGQTLQPGQGCSTLVGFVPTVPGARVARLVFTLTDGSAVERTISGMGVSQPLECVLDWAERTYPDLFLQPTPTQVASPYIGRCYQGGALCVGADVAVPTFAPASIYYLLHGQTGVLGRLSDFAATATQLPPATARCNQL
jgi:hypothetical protein